MKAIKYIPGLFIFLLLPFWAHTQGDTMTIHLQEAIDLVQLRSVRFKRLALDKLEADTRYSLFQKSRRPSLSLFMDLPQYNQSFTSVTQPDGGLVYQFVRQNESNFGLQATQLINRTGGVVFIQSNLQRFDDFEQGNYSFNSIPLSFGFEQSIGAFNPLKWQRRSAELERNHGRSKYTQESILIAAEASRKYFDCLFSQVNLEIAKKNYSVYKDLLDIASKRLELGQISKSEYLQLDLQVKSMSLSQENSMQDLRIAQSELLRLLNMDGQLDFKLVSPSKDIPLMYIDESKVVDLFLANNPELIRQKLSIIQADRDIDEAKKSYSPKAELQMYFGSSSSGTDLDLLYRDAEMQQNISLRLQLPIVNWGMGREQLKLAKAKKDLTLIENERNLDNGLMDLRLKVQQFNLLATQLELLEQADWIASDRFKILEKKYRIDPISVFELIQARMDKDTAKRSLILAWKTYWTTYYELCALAQYDFILSKSLN